MRPEHPTGTASPSIWPPLTTTMLALVLMNLGAAFLIVRAMGTRVFGLSAWVAVVILLVGMACVALAVWQWRAFVRSSRLGKGVPTGQKGHP